MRRTSRTVCAVRRRLRIPMAPSATRMRRLPGARRQGSPTASPRRGRAGLVPRRRLGSESVLVDLFRAEHGQLLGLEAPARRDCEGGRDAAARPRRTRQVGPGGSGTVDDHDGGDSRTQAGVRQPEHRGVQDAGHPDQRVLDREGGDVPPPRSMSPRCGR